MLARDFTTSIAELGKAHALRPQERMVMYRLERLRLLQNPKSHG